MQRPKPDVARDPGFQERDWSRIREAQERLQRTIDPVADRALLRWALGQAATLAADQRLEPVDKAAGLNAGMDKASAGKAIDSYLDGLYAGTKLADHDFRLGLIEKSTADLVATNDPFIALAAALEPLAEANREAAKNRAGAYARIRPLYMEAMLEKAGGLLAPDANSTLRVTYGQVKGVDARDGLFYKPQTTLAGIVEKHTGSGDFDAPQKQLDAIKALRAGKQTPFLDAGVKDVPVNFLSTVDTTGGNSGSPTLNAKGELVGLLFDGTYESVSSDFLFDTVKTRSIHVDSRYMLWTMAEVDGARRLLDEMGVSLKPVPAAQGAGQSKSAGLLGPGLTWVGSARPGHAGQKPTCSIPGAYPTQSSAGVRNERAVVGHAHRAGMCGERVDLRHPPRVSVRAQATAPARRMPPGQRHGTVIR